MTPAPSARAVELLERLVREQEARERERLLDRPRRLYAELDRRYRDALSQNVVSRTVVLRTDDGLIRLNENSEAMRVEVTNADRIAAEISQAMEFVREAEELARQAHRLPRAELVARCAELARRAGVELLD